MKMRRSMTTSSSRIVVGVAVGVVIVAYAWWATGVPPFTVRAYVAVGAAAVLLIVAAVIGPAARHRGKVVRPSNDGSPRAARAFPWVILLVFAVALEALGLALGGESSTVPTLSTVIDHAMSTHIVRFILLVLWLAAGWIPVARALKRAPATTEGID